VVLDAFLAAGEIALVRIGTVAAPDVDGPPSTSPRVYTQGDTDGEAGDPNGFAYGEGATNANPPGDAFDPVAFAEGQQGTPPYTGVDSYTAGTLKPGDVIYQLGDKTPEGGQSVGYFFDETGESVLTAPSGAAAMDDLQVNIHPDFGPYDGYTTFEVTDEIPYATGTVTANPQFGVGGATQGVIDTSQFGECLRPVCFTRFPNGAGDE
jgi:hypothetical protein